MKKNRLTLKSIATMHGGATNDREGETKLMYHDIFKKYQILLK